jgi:hypothetical protein
LIAPTVAKDYVRLAYIKTVLNKALEEMARADAKTHPEIWEWFKNKADLSIDHISDTRIRIDLEGGGISAHWIADIGNYGAMGRDEFEKRVSHVARQNLSLVAQMHWARLDRMFPKAIKNCELERNLDTMRHRLIVTFRNGHVADCFEDEAKDDLFTAKCIMLYDLPPL